MSNDGPSLAPEPGTSPLLEADPHSLDDLWQRIDAKLVAGLPQDITDGDIDAVTARLWAQRDKFIQDQLEASLKPKRTRNSGAKPAATIREIQVTW